MSTDDKPAKPKTPPTTVGTLARINKLLAAHTPGDQRKILVFLSAGE